MKILVVEDEISAATTLLSGLREEGFAADHAATSEAADTAIAVMEYDAVLLDVMIPGARNGFELCERWRASGNSTPILFLTARDDVRDRVYGLDLGGDDYLVKPFAFEELLARLRVLLRRGSGEHRSELHFGELTLDLSRHLVKRRGTEITLTPREFSMLQYFATRPGKLVTRTQLWEHVWETGSEPDSNVVDVYIRYLRDKLGRDPDLIQTIRGVGYVLTEG